ncbi:Hypothetical_protein [Hexamita inflata]|uniref:Hypothetical_protein n=1 Tax=Hexamita inflata TaxID=28002 RepID=A0AA86TTG1_9EUKA|nr:Hypothetical protein HINF_LOCUS15405 [Hexamita inflata]
MLISVTSHSGLSLIPGYFPVQIFLVRSRNPPENGNSFVVMTQRTTPRAHISVLLPYCSALHICGLRQYGVPVSVCACSSILDTPKSASLKTILSSYLCTRILSGFTSL